MFNKKIVIGILLTIIICSSSYAGLKVEPGAFCMQNAEIGKDLDLGIDLIITNTGGEEQEYTVKPIKPSQAKSKWLKGYSEIPDPSWFYFTKNEVKVGPYGQGKLRMHLNIPDSESYYNQHWMVYVDVSTKPEKGQMFALSIKPNYMIETKAKAEVEEIPYGELGLVPSVIRAENIPRWEEEKVQFKIYNNDKVKHTYKITNYFPKASTERQDISLTSGYDLIGKTFWAKPAVNYLRLKPGEAKNVDVNILIPKRAKPSDKGWESIILVEPDKGLAGFVRVLIEPKINKKGGEKTL